MSERQFDSPPRWTGVREAKYGSTCVVCGEPVEEGDQVYMKPEVNSDTGRKVWHVRHERHGEPGA